MAEVARMVRALGGAANIADIEGCVTRVRVEVVDADRVDDDALRDQGALAVVHAGTVIQVVVGPHADGLALDMAREVAVKRLIAS